MKIILVVFALFLSLTTVACCGIIGATIGYEPIEGYAYVVEVEVFTCLSAPSDLPEILVDFGGGQEIVPRISILDDVTRDLRRSIYSATHTFPGPGSFIIHAEVGGRVGGIVNIPNSISQTICMEAFLRIDPITGPNHSIHFNVPPTEVVQNWNTFSYQPEPTDLDADSLSFELIAPSGLYCMPITGYQVPSGLNYLWLDPTTGNVLWDYPPFNGEYSLVIRGSEYRNGQLIGQVTRDMTICVSGFIASLGEVELEVPFAVHPSLANDQIRIEAQGLWSVTIVDATGRVSLQRNKISSNVPLSISALSNGPYMLQAVDSEGNYRTARFVKR